MNIRPLGDLIVVKRNPALEATLAGIILPTIAQEKLHYGKVVAVGPGKKLPTGKRVPMELQGGETVYFSRFEHMPFKMGDEEYVTMHEADVIGVVE